MARYSIRVSWSEEDSLFVALCPALGDLSALGATAQEAVAELEQAIGLALETYESEGWVVPEPDAMEEYSGQFRLRLPRSQHGWLAREAERQGVSLNSLVSNILAQAQGATEAHLAVSEEIGAELRALRASLTSTMRDTIFEVAADTSSSWTFDEQPTFQVRGSQSETLKLVQSAG